MPGFILLLGMAGIGFLLGFLACNQGWHHSLSKFSSVLFTDPAFALSTLLGRSRIPTFAIDLAFEDYQYLVEQRESALSLGANLLSEESAVPATITFQQEPPTSMALSLAEGPAEVFLEDQWPLHLTSVSEEPFRGLLEATLTPADEDAILSWGYLETLREEGFPVPDSTLVRLTLNGRPWGLYVFEGLPVSENAQPQHFVATFDPHNLLEAKIQLGTFPPQNRFAYSRITLRGERTLTLEDNPELAAVGLEACSLLKDLEAGALSPSDIFDPERVGRFLALTTFWRGETSLNWPTLSFVYDPTLRQFEPVGTGRPALIPAALPGFFFDDPGLQRVYIRELEALSQGETLSVSRRTSQDILQRAASLDLGYPDSPETRLRENQTWIRQLLSPSTVLSAEVLSVRESLILRLVNVQPFPVELLAMDLGESASLPFDPAWVSSSEDAFFLSPSEDIVLRGRVMESSSPVQLTIPIEALPAEWGELRLITRLWGADRQIVVLVHESDLSFVARSDE